MWFLPKDYVGVHTRVESFHKEHKEWMSINTEFKLQDNVAIFKATVTTKKWTFTWSSFWEVWKEKAFEKLETVAVGRALAFAWYEVKSWIASRDEMEVFESNKKPKEKHNCLKCNKDVEVEPFNWKFWMCFKCPSCNQFSKTNRIHDGDDSIANPPF